MRPTNCSGRQSGKPRRRPGWDHPLRAMRGFWCEPHVGRKPGMGFVRIVRHGGWRRWRAEEHTSELQSLRHLVCRLLLEKKKKHEREPRGLLMDAPLECARGYTHGR